MTASRTDFDLSGPGGETPSHHGSASAGCAYLGDRGRESADPLVDLVGGYRRVRQAQRVAAALDQEVAALHHRYAALGGRWQQLVDVDVLGQLDPQEVPAVRLGEPGVRYMLT